MSTFGANNAEGMRLLTRQNLDSTNAEVRTVARLIFFGVTGNVTLAPLKVDLNITPVSSTLHKQLPLVAVALALTMASPTLTIAINVAPAATTLAISAATPTIAHGIVVDAATLTITSASSTMALNLAPTTPALALAMATPSLLVVGGNIDLAPALFALSFAMATSTVRVALPERGYSEREMEERMATYITWQRFKP